jgi:hypothetical protein
VVLQRGEGEIAIISLVVVVGILLVGGCMIGYPHYQVYQQRLEGEAILEKQKSEKQVAVQSALAKKESAQMLAEALKLNQKLLAEYNKENAKVLEIDKKKAINDEIKLQKELAESISDRTKNLKNYKKVEGQGSITTEFVVQKERELSVLKTEAILSKGRLKDLQGLTQAEKEAAKASDEKTNTQVANGARTIDVIDAEIKAQEELVKGLSDKTGKEGRSIKAKIAALTAEREQIYSTAKAEKEKQDNGLKNAKKTNDALYQLSQFRYQNEINNNQKIIDNTV